MFRNSERGKENDRNKGYLKKATIRGTADYLSFGLGEDKDNRNYEERLNKPYVRLKSGSKV